MTNDHETEPRTVNASSIDALTIDSEPYLSCDNCFEQTDEAIEALLAQRRDLDRAFVVHLRACPACRDEARTLAEFAAAEYGLTSHDAVARFDRQLVPR